MGNTVYANIGVWLCMDFLSPEGEGYASEMRTVRFFVSIYYLLKH